MYTVNFIGLNYFDACKVPHIDVLTPNGTPGSGKDDDQIPEHFASLFIEEELCAGDDWWPEHKQIRQVPLEIKIGEFRIANVVEFRIPPKTDPYTDPAVIHFQCKDKTFNNVNLETGLPVLQDMGFVLADRPNAIAKVPLPGGAVEVFRFGGATLVRWLISEHDDPITISAYDGKKTRHVMLKKSDGNVPPEIVFSNTVDLLTPLPSFNGNGQTVHGGMAPGNGHGGMTAVHGSDAAGSMHNHGSAGHFVLYAKLDKDGDEQKFESPKLPDPLKLKAASFSNAYLAYLSSLEETPDPPCSGGCC
jgi:hypothetical protein